MSLFKKIDQNKLLILIAIVAVAIMGGLMLTSSNNGFSLPGLSGQSVQKIGEKAVSYINNNGLSSTPATLSKVSEENGLVKIKIKIGETEFDSYATKNGKLLFPQAFDMSDSNELENSGNQPTQGSEPASFSISKEDNVLGNFDAPVTLVVFSVFQFYFCISLYPT